MSENSPQNLRRPDGPTDPVRVRISRGLPVLSVKTVLALFAALPLSAGLGLAAWEANQANDARSQAVEIERLAAELVELTEIRSAVIDERNWVSGIIGIESFGLTSDAIVPLTGIDLNAERMEAAEQVDRLAAETGRTDIADRVEALRMMNDGPTIELGIGRLTEVGEAYTELELEIGAESNARLDELLGAAGEIGGAGDLVPSLRVLERSATARDSVAVALTAYFSAQFSALEGQDRDSATLVEARSSLRESRAEIRRVADADSSALRQLEAIDQLESVETFDAAVDVLVADAFGGDLAAADLGAVFANLDETVATFQAGTDSSAAHLALVTAAGADVDRAAAEVSLAARTRALRVMAFALVLALGTVLLTIALIRSIVRPLWLLADGAARMRRGETDAAIPVEGTLETRQAALALNEAAASLALFQHHTEALANGALDEIELSDDPDGPLETSVHTAVRTLSESIAEREEFRDRLAFEAAHDGLTQIANRRASLDQLKSGLARAERRDATIALLFIDLDGFKDVNDRFGHRAGDLVLRRTADRLAVCLRDGDHLGRLGGDEFLVILEDVQGVGRCLEVAERLLAELSQPIEIGTLELTPRASIGIAMNDVPGTTPSTMLHEADLAVYEAKAAGRNAIRLCDDHLRAKVADEARLAEELRAALDDDQFELWYQPLVEVGSLDVVGHEVLVRWQHPTRGLVTPNEFIPFAERSDLILDIDRWVLEHAISRLADDDHAGIRSINVSGRHLGSDSFLADVMGPIRRWGIDPSRIEIEVTESAVLDDLDRAGERLQALRSEGVRVAIDDFGTGYASLSHLQMLPIDVVKVDRTFTKDESSQSLARLIVETGHLLGLSVTAEGVETADQSAALEAMGVDTFQGYLFGRPEPEPHRVLASQTARSN